MVAKGTLTKPLAEGEYHLEVKLGSSVVFKHDGSLCGESSAKVTTQTFLFLVLCHPERGLI